MDVRMSVERLEGRLLFAAGDVDLTFGGGDGVADAPAGGGGNAVAFADDGSFVVAGSGDELVGGFATFRLVRYRPDGSLDTTFGRGGDDGDGVVTTSQVNSPGGASLVVVAPDGKIVAAGGGVNLVRYNPDGSIDTTFGECGTVRTPAGHPQGILGIQFQDDGKMLVGVEEAGPFTPEFGIIFRYNDDGTLDTAYQHPTQYLPGTGPDSDGHGLKQVGPFSVWVPDESAPTTPKLVHAKDSAFAAARQSDGKIVALAYAYTLDARRDLHTAVLRFNADGSLDPTFASSVQWDNGFTGKRVAVQPGNGRILLIGGDHFRVVAVQSAPPLDAPRPVPDALPEATRTPLDIQEIQSSVTGATFQIRYEDDAGIDVSSLGADDVRVTLPVPETLPPQPPGSRGSVMAEFVAVDDSTDGRVRVATYHYTHTDGPFTEGDAGVYTISIEPGAVLDTAGQAVSPGPLPGLSWFSVHIQTTANSIRPTATVVSAPGVTSPSTSSVPIVVRYEDDQGIIGSHIDGGDIRVTAPDGSFTFAQPLGGPFTGDQTPREVTYAYVPPAGGFSFASNGDYRISLESAQVFDTSGLAVIGQFQAGRFRVEIPSDGPNLTVGPVAARVGPGAQVAAGSRPRGRLLFVVTNGGNRPAAGRVTYSVVASADEQFGAGDTEIASATRRLALRPSASRRIVLRPHRIPADLAAGDYHLLARVDTAETIAETNEIDNTSPPSDAFLHVVAAGRQKSHRPSDGLFGTVGILED